MTIKELHECKAQPAPVQQEPVATITITQRGSTRTIDNHFEDCVRGWPDGEYKLYTSPQPAQRKLPPEWYAQWIRNNYQDHPNIATLCEEMTKAAHGIKENT